ncbi:MAG: hypothetical protein AABY22_09175 [Nanoarchaeota archaeon]
MKHTFASTKIEVYAEGPNAQKENELIFKEMIRRVRPDLFVLIDLLDSTGVNPLVIWKVIRQLKNISLGTNYGQIIIEVQAGKVTFIRGSEADRVEEYIILGEQHK